MILHNHIFQVHTINGAWDCPACKTIRPEVMTKTAVNILRNPQTAHVFGSPTTTTTTTENQKYIPTSF